MEEETVPEETVIESPIESVVPTGPLLEETIPPDKKDIITSEAEDIIKPPPQIIENQNEVQSNSSPPLILLDILYTTFVIIFTL